MEQPRFSSPACSNCDQDPDTFPSSPNLSLISLRSRQHREELCALNERLAAYFEEVRAQGAAQAALELRLDQDSVEAERQVRLLQKRYQEELAEAHLLLNQQFSQRTAAELQLDALREEFDQLRDRNLKKENDLSVAITQIRALEAQLLSKEADLGTALSRQGSLEKDFQESKEQIVSLKETVKDTKNQLQDERLKRIHQENQTKMLQGYVEFLKGLHEQELKRKKSFYETKIEEMESGHQQAIQSNLVDALQALRQEQEQQIMEYKKQTELTFAAKIENAQLCTAENSYFVNSLQEELKEMKLETETLTLQNSALEAKISELEAMITGLEKAVDCEHNIHMRYVMEKDKEIAEVQQQTEDALKKYMDLLDVKLKLDLEIRTYRVMLEREEKRFGLGKYSSKSSGMHATTSQDCLFPQAKKRESALMEKQGAMVDLKAVELASSMRAISIEKIDPEGKFVRIKNNSDKDQSLSGWTLQRVYRNELDVMHQFPTQFILEAGQVVSIWRDDPQGLGLSFVWKSQKSSGSDEDISFTLLNTSGEEVADSKIIHAGRGDDYDREKDQEEANNLFTGKKKKKTRLV